MPLKMGTAGKLLLFRRCCDCHRHEVVHSREGIGVLDILAALRVFLWITRVR